MYNTLLPYMLTINFIGLILNVVMLEDYPYRSLILIALILPGTIIQSKQYLKLKYPSDKWKTSKYSKKN